VANDEVERRIVELIGCFKSSVNDESPSGSRLARTEFVFEECYGSANGIRVCIESFGEHVKAAKQSECVTSRVNIAANPSQKHSQTGDVGLRKVRDCVFKPVFLDGANIASFDGLLKARSDTAVQRWKKLKIKYIRFGRTIGRGQCAKPKRPT